MIENIAAGTVDNLVTSNNKQTAAVNDDATQATAVEAQSNDETPSTIVAINGAAPDEPSTYSFGGIKKPPP